ncbi:hypothetical protein [Asticcacaulis tiandongensis]|uniref:hypothetical protein n=1 Tax=Asticcacaulis tiandongensis TaxID=2565365 RepID=UPI00112EC055|nr:hypothetical protein [Asticcacaulis tiandongensis]
MQLSVEEQYYKIIGPGFTDYLEAERALTAASLSGDNAALEAAKFKALRLASNVATDLHHFAEIVVHRAPHGIDVSGGEKALRPRVETHCRFLRGDAHVSDLTLLCDVVDALKHSRLRNSNRMVSDRDAVLVIGSGWGKVRFFGEGKYGGKPQVLVEAKSGTRAMSSVLQNVIDAWKNYLRWPITDLRQI